MGSSYTLVDAGGYQLFQPPAEETVENYIAAYNECQKANQAFIRSKKGDLTVAMPITGTFIYAHSPTYWGTETMTWSKRDWLTALGRLKDLGNDTVVFQASLWSNFGECYYPSKRFSSYPRQWNVIEPMLEAAKELSLSVFLGGYGSVTCWQEEIDLATIDQEIENQLGCYRELLAYRDAIDGFYFAPESSFIGKRNYQLEELQSRLYGEIFSEIRRVDPTLKILMSPATFYFPEPGVMDEMVDAWCAIFSKAHPDIIAPQDSIGCLCITLDHQAEALANWQKICRKCGIRLWSNVEIFDACPPYLGKGARCAAKPDRVACQINNAAPYVGKLITWEALWFLGAQPELGAPLRRFFPKYFNQTV